MGYGLYPLVLLWEGGGREKDWGLFINDVSYITGIFDPSTCPNLLSFGQDLGTLSVDIICAWPLGVLLPHHDKQSL